MVRLGPATLILMLAVAAAAPKKKEDEVPRTELAHPCSRHITRSVRKQLEKEILRPLKRQGFEEWPKGCPLDPARDLFGYHEKQKQRKKPGSAAATWTCGICGKQFKNEHYLDLHMERKHMNETPAEGVCLADYCELFEVCFGEEKWRRNKATCNEAQWPDLNNGVVCGPCKVLVNRFDSKYGSSCKTYCESMGRQCVDGWEDRANGCDVKEWFGCERVYNGTSNAICQCSKTQVPICSNASMKRHRRRCEDSLRACFPLGNETTRKLYAKWSRTLCANIDCRIREEKQKEHEGAFIPVIVLLILVVLVGFIAFSVVLCCVDYGEEILEWMIEVGLASADWVKSFRRCRDTVKKEVGLQQERTKAI